MHAGFVALGQRMSGIDHCHQWFAKQLLCNQALGQGQWAHQSDFYGLVEQGVGYRLTAHFTEIQVHRRKTLAKGVDGLGDAGVERR
ncbi:hypothetical protein D3C77_564180 [compost metagenome]